MRLSVTVVLYLRCPTALFAFHPHLALKHFLTCQSDSSLNSASTGSNNSTHITHHTSQAHTLHPTLYHQHRYPGFVFSRTTHSISHSSAPTHESSVLPLECPPVIRPPSASRNPERRAERSQKGCRKPEAGQKHALCQWDPTTPSSLRLMRPSR